MEDLVRWLRAQYDAEAEEARAAAEELGPDWYYDDGFVLARREDDMVATGSQDFLERERGVHIAAHDPARVLRDIEAKRRTLARHCAAPVPPGNEWVAEYPYCAAHAYAGPDGSTIYPVELKDCPELRDLAAPYADRDGYLDSWRP
jgi:hypothetical protein